jgi:hypothetical protein
MIKITVNSLWIDKVGIRDKYVKEAEVNGEGIEITHGDAVMILPASELKYKIVGRSEHPFLDKYSNEKHYLVYFTWHPSILQHSLL